MGKDILALDNKKTSRSVPGKDVLKFIKKHSTAFLKHQDNTDEFNDTVEEQVEDNEDQGSGEKSENSASSPFNGLSFEVGVSENRNSHYRQSMEDVHTYVANFAERLDWGYFAIFDGHAGKQTARWCGSNLHNILYDNISRHEDMDLRDNLNQAFRDADEKIGQLKIAGSSGCTAAVAVLRWEEEINAEEESELGGTLKVDAQDKENVTSKEIHKEGIQESGRNILDTVQENKTTTGEPEKAEQGLKTENTKQLPSAEASNSMPFDFIPTKKHRRMLYTANVGDSRIVLCRHGQAKRLSYDHKSTDGWEQKRIANNGGIMLKSRVNGVLAITRALGDCYMKNLVVGAPYTTSTEIGDDDEFLILACDGLWDVCTDQQAVDLIRNVKDPKKASSILCKYALEQMTTDNITVMVVRLDSRVFNYRK
ncbi:hypothetical protein HII12_001702 [Brettanomyces bruxellensis]|uniref:PPM-type phosphatase domain-containing protein n=1 Tax=Dekkera bruxellensis TaxID=5007 RepID=A0A8H6BJX5_DEKBR|nr:hypothetical protein HII12_001702 [Brettanomyces bruxellensis]